MRIDDTFLDASGKPIAGTGDAVYYRQQLLARAGVHWFTADPAWLTKTVDRHVSLLTDLAGSTMTFFQTTDAARPQLLARGIGQYTALGFDGAVSALGAGNVPIDFTKPYSVATVFKPASFAAASYPWGILSGATARSYLTLSTAGQASFVHGGEATPGQVIALNAWHLSIAAFDGKTLIHRLDGVEVSTAALTGGGGASALFLGAYGNAASAAAGFFPGSIAEVLLTQDVLFDSPDVINSLEQLMAGIYPISLGAA